MAGGGGVLCLTNDARVVRVELEPRERILAPGSKLQLRVNATYSDGRKADVTRFCVFQSNNDSLAKVDEHGVVNIGSLPGQTSVMARYLGEVTSFLAIVPRPGKPVGDAGFAEFNFIDRHVNAHLKKLNLRPSEVCDDATFLRRASLDIIGTLPTADEARRFLADKASDKRAQFVESLLKRPEFADFWALKWADLLRVDRQKLGQRDAYAYYRWIRDQFAANRPLDQFARALLTAEGRWTTRPPVISTRSSRGPATWRTRSRRSSSVSDSRARSAITIPSTAGARRIITACRACSHR